MRKLIKLCLVLITALLGVSVLLLSSNIYTYHRLGHETLIAEVYFETHTAEDLHNGMYSAGNQQWTAHLATGDRCFVDEYLINGDQWRVDASFVKWENWVNLMGLDSLYRLERLEGRFSDIDEQKRRIPLAHELADRKVMELRPLAEQIGRLNILMDASYGSSVYQTIDPQQIYYLYKTQSGLITRSKPRTVEVSVREMVTIQINKACGQEDGEYKKAVNWLDSKLGAFL